MRRYKYPTINTDTYRMNWEEREGIEEMRRRGNKDWKEGRGGGERNRRREG